MNWRKWKKERNKEKNLEFYKNSYQCSNLSQDFFSGFSQKWILKEFPIFPKKFGTWWNQSKFVNCVFFRYTKR